MTETSMTERELLEDFRTAGEERKRLAAALDKATKKYEELENMLIQALTAQGKTTTAEYQGLGYARLIKPEVRASYLQDRKEEVFSFLEACGEGALVKRDIPGRTLSGFVRRRLEAGWEVPNCITYFLKPGVRMYENGKWVA